MLPPGERVCEDAGEHEHVCEGVWRSMGVCRVCGMSMCVSVYVGEHVWRRVCGCVSR